MRPYIVCHMVASIDGRIDCAMVDQICGDEYYTTLAELDCPSALEGRVTREHYSADPTPLAIKTIHLSASFLFMWQGSQEAMPLLRTRKES